MNYQNEKEFLALVDKVRQIDGHSSILEIGSLIGETLRYWIQMAKLIVSIDMIVPESDARHEDQQYGHEVLWPTWAKDNGVDLYVLNRDSRSPACVQAVRRLSTRFDFLFIDGGHDFDTCCKDYQNYGPLVRKGGIIAFHDLCGNDWPDVRRVWDSIREPGTKEEFYDTTTGKQAYGIGVFHVL